LNSNILERKPALERVSDAGALAAARRKICSMERQRYQRFV
jgi:hypothetical protein